jgi:3-methyladenine DNA glycosylase Tag
MDEEIELKDNKINVLEKELKDVNHYDEQKIQTLLNKNLVIRNNNKELNVDSISRNALFMR